MAVQSAQKLRKMRRDPPADRSRESLRRARVLVFDAVARCCKEGRSTVITGPELNPAEVQLAFDEFRDKHHLMSVEASLDRRGNGDLVAIFDPRPGRSNEPD